MNHNLLTQVTLDATIVAARVAAYAFDRAAKSAQDEADATAEGLPKVTGLASDVTSGMRAALKHAGSTAAEVFEVSADVARGTELVAQQAKEVASLQSQIEISAKEKKEALGNELSMLAVLVRQEASTRLELFTAQEALQQLIGRYDAAVASGLRSLDDRLQFRKGTAAWSKQYRYKDMAFRIFRTDS